MTFPPFPFTLSDYDEEESSLEQSETNSVGVTEKNSYDEMFVVCSPPLSTTMLHEEIIKYNSLLEFITDNGFVNPRDLEEIVCDNNFIVDNSIVYNIPFQLEPTEQILSNIIKILAIASKHLQHFTFDEIIALKTLDDIKQLDGNNTITTKLEYTYLYLFKIANKYNKEVQDKINNLKGYSDAQIRKKFKIGNLIYKYPVLLFCKFTFKTDINMFENNELVKWNNLNGSFVERYRSMLSACLKK
ncbi:hypothetical protein ABK040_007757 [Willaertia magna]